MDHISNTSPSSAEMPDDSIENQHNNEVPVKSVYHSVELEADSCKGCTICVTGCPVEAIRVHDGKAHILEERCIDCGECIRRCPNHAKQAKSPDLAILANYDSRAVLVPPSFYAQFDKKYSNHQLKNSLISLGFTDIFDVSEDAAEISRATVSFLKNTKSLPKPLISSSCPTIIKLIQIRFPSLIDNLLPLLPPVELTARRARYKLEAKHKINNDGDICKAGVFFISPCPAKMTVARSPLGYPKSEIDAVFSISALYLPMLNSLKSTKHDDLETNKEEPPNTSPTSIQAKDNFDSYNPLIWSRERGEAESIVHFQNGKNDKSKAFQQNDAQKNDGQTFKNFEWLSAGGIQQAISLLESIEDGQCNNYDFAEIAACSGGCIGGPLVISSVPEAEAALRARLEFDSDKTEESEAISMQQDNGNNEIGISNSTTYKTIAWTEDILPRPSRKLSNDFKQARRMMEKQEDIIKQLPGLDCGSCGAPNCKALAEDIVRGNAKIEDCVTILKAQYEQLLFGKH